MARKRAEPGELKSRRRHPISLMIETSSSPASVGFFIGSTPQGDIAMALTAKQEAFAQAIADGLNQSDAYRKAYNAAKQTDATLWANASRTAGDSKVLARVAELKAATASKALWTRERSVIALASIADGAEAKASEITAAIKELNLMHGFNAPVEVNLSGSVITRIERLVIDPKA